MTGLEPVELFVDGDIGGYLVPVSCPRCGGPVEHVTASKPYVNDSRYLRFSAAVSAICRCPEGHGTWQVRVTLESAGDERAKRHKQESRNR